MHVGIEGWSVWSDLTDELLQVLKKLISVFLFWQQKQEQHNIRHVFVVLCLISVQTP